MMFFTLMMKMNLQTLNQFWQEKHPNQHKQQHSQDLYQNRVYEKKMLNNQRELSLRAALH